MEVTELISELKALKSKIKGVSSGLCCSYGNLLLMIGHFFDTIIMAPTEKEVITSQKYTWLVKSEEN